MQKSFFLIILFIPFFVFGNTFKDKLQNAKVGSYIITYQNKTYSLLVVDKVSANQITISEINFIKSKFKEIKSWKKWLDNGAQGNQSYISYTIDLEKNKIIDCYSHLRKAKLSINNDALPLSKLLTMPLTRIKNEDRRKIGPSPRFGEMDTRKIWSPPMIINGEKIKNANFDAFETFFPEDNSELSGKNIHLYFDKENKFPFPFWIQINTDHLKVVLQVIDSGNDLIIENKIL
jgi:hypothetical protein